MKRLNQRGLIGYKYYGNRPNSTQKVPLRDLYTTMEHKPAVRDLDIQGAGLMDMVRSVYNKIPSYTDVLNVIPASDENARPAFEGEKHAILKLPNGRMGVANYMG